MGGVGPFTAWFILTGFVRMGCVTFCWVGKNKTKTALTVREQRVTLISLTNSIFSNGLRQKHKYKCGLLPRAFKC